MRCKRCGKKFDEELYNGICPECGNFNPSEEEYDVSQYISASFDDAGRYDTKGQAEQSHEKLHRMYDGQSAKEAHTPDWQNTVRQKAEQWQNTARQKSEHWQDASGQKVEAKQGTFRQRAETRQGAFGQKAVNGSEKSRSTYSKAEKKPEYGTGEASGNKRRSAVRVMVLIMVIAVAVTVILRMAARAIAMNAFEKLSYEETAYGVGEAFEVNGRTLAAEGAEVIDTSMLGGLPEGEKLVAVTVRISESDDAGYNVETGHVYVSCGGVCKENIDSTGAEELYPALEAAGVPEEDILTEYSYLGYSTVDGKTGEFLFFVEEDERELKLCFEEWSDKIGVSVLKKRAAVSMPIREG